MRYSEILAPRVLFTIAAVLFISAVWFAISSSGARDVTPAPRAAARSVLRQINRPVAVTGRIRRAQWSHAGGSDAVAIVVPGVGTFRIADSGRGRELKDHIGDTVRVVAVTRLDPHGREILDVEDYSISAL